MHAERRALPAQLEGVHSLLQGYGFERCAAYGAARWQGHWNGRACRVSVSTLGRTRYHGDARRREHVGIVLRLDITTPVRAQFMPVKRTLADNFVVRRLYRLRGLAVVMPATPLPQDYAVVASEVDWAQRLLAQREASLVVAELIKEDASASLDGSAYLNPTSRSGVWYYASPHLAAAQITPVRVVQALQRLEAIAVAAEALPAPLRPVQPTKLGRFAEDHPWAIALGLLLGVLLVLGSTAVLMIVVGYLLFG